MLSAVISEEIMCIESTERERERERERFSVGLSEPASLTLTSEAQTPTPPRERELSVESLLPLQPLDLDTEPAREEEIPAERQTSAASSSAQTAASRRSSSRSLTDSTSKLQQKRHSLGSGELFRFKNRADAITGGTYGGRGV